VRLADPAAVATLLDPFCGTGTIAIEAKLWGASLDVRASDLEADAVDAARQNAEAAGVAVGFAVADAAALSVADGSAGCIVTNPPWGIRVEAHGGLASGLAPFWESADSALGADGHIAVLAPGSTEPGLPHVGFEVVNRTEVRVSGALAQLVVYARR
jgi:23S rRNA G2445 N2-methylase RlmL